MHAGGKIIIEQSDEDYDCIVDAIFGTGLSRTVIGIFEQAIHWINQQQQAVILSVDIPSGLDADTGLIRGCAVWADITVSILCYKAGQFTNFGKDLCGKLFLENIGVANTIISKVPSKVKLLDTAVLKSKELVRQHNTHKGTYGTAVIVGGHDGMLGALMLAGQSALRSGCGMVEVVSNSSRSVMISIQCPELITASSVHASLLLEKADVLAIGPGLGLNQHSSEILEFCIKKNKAMVIDADALTLSTNKYKFNKQTVLTPHPKEAARLLQTTVEMIQSDRITAALEISKLYKATVILKGSGTLVANPEGEVYICPFGYSGMATAGMGDVLCGMVAGLMAQGLKATRAAYIAVVWHALSAQKCQLGNCLIASDVINNLAPTLYDES